MATVTSSYAIGVTIDADGTGFVTGTEQAEQAMRDLASTTDLAAQDIDTSLATDVPASADSSAVSLTTKASKFKAVGTELGTNLAGGIAGGASGPEAVAGTAQSLSGLLAASASTATGALAAAGLGLGVAVVVNLIKGVQERRQEFIDSVNSMWDSIEVTAKSTFASIREDLLATFDLPAIINQVGGGDPTLGLSKIRDAAADINVPFSDLVDILRGDITPANRYILGLLKDQSKEIAYTTQIKGAYVEKLTEEGQRAKDLLGVQEANNDKVRTATELAKAEAGYKKDSLDNTVALEAATTALVDPMKRTAEQAERYAAAVERADAAAARLNDRAGLNGNADTAR